MPIFACNECQSPAFVIGGKLTDETVVTCDDCGARLGSWAEFRRRLERRLASSLEFDGAKASRAPRRKSAAVRLA